MGDAEQTRQKILTVAADEIHQHGFKATSLSVILSRCNISKGALYYHFTNKLELGYAVFEENFIPMFLGTWQPALGEDDPIEGLCAFFTGMTDEMAIESWGEPDEVNRSVNAFGTNEQWIYGSITSRKYLYFDNGILTSWQD